MSSNDSSSKEKESVKPKKSYPKSVFFIISNEFCERFNYYGLRTILTIYLTKRLYYSENTATIIFHLFAMLAYFTPLMGAMIADSLLGKFKTILYLSILYAIGGVIISAGSFPQELSTMKLISLIGLFIVGVGTGGIKPCVSAFGGDQFEEGQEKQLQRFFSIFYLSINLGSLVSTFLTPILREDVHCLGEETCFPLAFGVPSILMIFAVVLFVCGKPLYKIRPPEGNIVIRVSKCICYALSKKCKGSEKSSSAKSHWLDNAEDKFDKKLIEEIKILLHVLVLYIPLPVFWALFDQQGSRWTLQATRMDGAVQGFHIKADQMQVINPFLIVAFIPLFDYVIYPILEQCNLLKKPLQRITTGGILAAISFVIAGLIELKLETNLPVMPQPGHSHLILINNSPCSVKIEGADLPDMKPFSTGFKDLQLNEGYQWKFISEQCTDAPKDFSFNASSPVESMMITIQGRSLVVMKEKDSKQKSKSGYPKMRIFYNIDLPKHEGNMSFKLEREDADDVYYIHPEVDTEVQFSHVGTTEYHNIHPGKYKILLPYNQTKYREIPTAHEDMKSGGIYIVSIYSTEQRTNSSVYEMVKGNDISILLQIPQYVIITAGEIMFSITGLEFSYSQAPKSMKSVIQAAWLLTVAFGNLIVLVIAKLKLFEKQSYELFLFAVLMGIDMIIFAVLAYYYKYVKIQIGDSEAEEETSPKGRSNEAYVEETDFNK